MKLCQELLPPSVKYVIVLTKVSVRSERALMKTSILAMNQHPRNCYRHNGYIHWLHPQPKLTNLLNSFGSLVSPLLH